MRHAACLVDLTRDPTGTMMISLLLTSLAVLPAPVSSSLESVEITFSPEPGTRLEKTFTSSMEMESDELTSTTNGQPVPQQFLPQLEILIESSLEVRVRDTYSKVEEGRPLSFRRHFETLGGEGSFQMSMPPAPDEASDFETEHELEDEEVQFDWNAETESFDTKLIGSEETPDDLALLAADMDLLGFLPDEVVSEGDSWDIETAAMTALFQPGGALGLDEADDGGEAYESLEVSSELTATLKRVQRVDGMQQAVLVIEGEYNDKSQRPTTLDHIPITDGSAMEIMTVTYQIDGELIWNLSDGHAHSVGLEATFDLVTDTIRDDGQPGPGFTSKLTFMGEQSFAAEFTSVSD